MKKKVITVKDFMALRAAAAKAKKQVINELTEDARDLKESLVALLEELEQMTDVTVDEEEIDRRVREHLESFNNENEELRNLVVRLEKRITDTFAGVPKGEGMTQPVRNAVAVAILKAKNREDVKDSVEAVLTKNGISGLTFEQAVDYAIETTWETNNRMFDALRMQPLSKFFYSTQDVDDVGVVAHGWSDESESEKIVQAINASNKTLDTDYIYKIQEIAQKDLDEARDSGTEAQLLRWVSEELDQQIINSIIAVMLGSTNYSDITTIESLFGTGVTDYFRTAVTPPSSAADKTALTLADLRALADAVPNPRGKAKWLVIDRTTLTQISKFNYASGGSDFFHDIETVKGQIGVDEIYITSLAAEPVIFLPDGYWMKQRNYINVAYPNWKWNRQTYQKERNIGGAIHDLASVAFFDY